MVAGLVRRHSWGSGSYVEYEVLKVLTSGWSEANVYHAEDPPFYRDDCGLPEEYFEWIRGLEDGDRIIMYAPQLGRREEGFVVQRTDKRIVVRGESGWGSYYVRVNRGIGKRLTLLLERI
jgi:hypothetical protein